MTAERSRWSDDLGALRERLAEQLSAEGATHPEVAAAALAARGRCGVDRDRWSYELGLAEAQLEAVEGGEHPWDALPDGLRCRITAALAPGT